MNAELKRRLVKSLSKAIRAWLDNDKLAQQLNTEDGLDIGYIPQDFEGRLARLCVDVIDFSSVAQDEATQ